MVVRLEGPVWLLQPIPYFGERLTGDWIVEPKVDGWRLQVIKYENGKIEFFGRRLEKNPNWTDKLFFLVQACANLPAGIILDCELYSSAGRRFIPSLFAQKRRAEPIVFVFDIIFYMGKFIGNKKLSVRKRLLSQILFSPPFYLLDYRNWDGDINSSFAWVREKGMDFEGLVLKEASSLYPLNKGAPLATEDWRKLKWR